MEQVQPAPQPGDHPDRRAVSLAAPPTWSSERTEPVAVGALSPLHEALESVRGGRIIGVASARTAGSCIFCMAAEAATAQAINWMIRFGGALICIALTSERCDELALRPQGAGRPYRGGVSFAETVEARDGISTGISAADRAQTIRVAANPCSTRHDLTRPGHVLPIRVSANAVLGGAAPAAAAIDLMRLAGVGPAAVVCDVLDGSGEVIDYSAFVALCRAEDLPVVTTDDVLDHRLRTNRIIERVSERLVATAAGEFKAFTYQDRFTAAIHHALVHGCVSGTEPVPIRLHWQDTINDVFASDPPMTRSLSDLVTAGRGVLLYLAREVAVPPPWVGESQSAEMQPQGAASLSGYTAVQILQDIGVRTVQFVRVDE